MAAKRSDYYKHGARVSAAFVAAAADADAAAAWKSSLRNNIIFMYGVRACARVHACVRVRVHAGQTTTKSAARWRDLFHLGVHELVSRVEFRPVLARIHALT